MVRREEAAEEEEEIAPLRRQEEVEEEDTMAMRTVFRQEEVPLDDSLPQTPPPFQADLTPETQPTPPELAGEDEPSDLQAVRRHASIEPTPATVQRPNIQETSTVIPPQQRAGTIDVSLPPIHHEPSTLENSTFPDTDNPSQSDVVIEQLDVVIHEPQVVSPSAPFSDRHFSRAMRARYLRRL